jgi:hypothetical protein
MDVSPTSTELPTTAGRARWAAPVGLAAAGLLAGGVLAGTLTANATPTAVPSAVATSAPGTASGEATETHPARGDETVITGATADKVRAAVLAKYPGAKIDVVESISTGGYEAHIVTAAGKAMHVDVSKAFVVTASREGGPGGRGGPGGHSNTDPAHEAAESPARAAEEKAQDAQAGTPSG